MKISNFRASGAVTAILALFTCARIAEAAEEKPTSDPQELLVERFFERIKLARQKGDVAALLSFINDIELEWPKQKPPAYFRVVLELCGALTSTMPVDGARLDLVRKLVITALDAPGEKPVDAEVKLLFIIQSDADYVRGMIHGEKWREERYVRVRRWLATWRHLNEEKAKWEKKAGGVVYLNVRPPPETGLRSGVSPNAIKDPHLRKKYEEAITSNSERAKVNRIKHDLANLEATFPKYATRYIVNAYSTAPFQKEELERSMEEYGIDKDNRGAVLDNVTKRIEGRIAQEAKTPNTPPQVQITELEPPKDSPYYADRRLRKTLSFQMSAPKVEEILQKLTKETGVQLTRADDVQNDYPATGAMFVLEMPAWMVMENLIKTPQVEGRWEKDGSGYRVVRNGNPLVIPEVVREQEAASKSRFWLYLFIGIGALAALAIGVMVARRRQTPP